MSENGFPVLPDQEAIEERLLANRIVRTDAELARATRAGAVPGTSSNGGPTGRTERTIRSIKG
jgi:hypothetical protein